MSVKYTFVCKGLQNCDSIRMIIKGKTHMAIDTQN
jgi:hypothetical protein